MHGAKPFRGCYGYPRASAAADRARASLLEGKESAPLEGAEVLDWYLDRRGDMYALAVLIR